MPVGFEVSAMKASFSLSSLDRSGGLSADSPEHARLRSEKPYNSLTKKTRRAWESEFENWKHSIGGRDGDDSFLEPILPRINTFLMDNTLVDTCKEAVGELCMDHKWQLLEEVTREGKATSCAVETLCLEAVEKEIRCLRHWIRGMEKRLRPLNFATKISPLEQEEVAKTIQCLAVEVKAQGKVVAALIRHCECLAVAASAPEDQSPEEQGRVEQGREEQGREPAEGEDESSEEEGTALTSQQQQSGPKGSAADSLRITRQLEARWHHLYLRALEWQCYIKDFLFGQGFHPAKRRNSSETLSVERGTGAIASDEEAICSGEEEGEGSGEGKRGRRGRAAGQEGGGPRTKKARFGSEVELGEEKGGGDISESGGGQLESESSLVMEATESATVGPQLRIPVPLSSLEKSCIMKESPMHERVNNGHNLGYYVIRRVDTDSEAEMKQNGVGTKDEKSIEEGELSRDRAVEVGRMGKDFGDTEEDDDEEDEEWVYSHVANGKSSHPEDTKARKSLLYEIQSAKDSPMESACKKESPTGGIRTFPALKLSPTCLDVGSKAKFGSIRKWLRRGGQAGEESAESQEEQAPRRNPIDSCDASGEYTSSGNSSDAESQSSGDLDGSIATCRKSSSTLTTIPSLNAKASPLGAHELGISSLSLSPTEGDSTPIAEGRTFPGVSGSPSPPGKVVMRSKRRKSKTAGHHQRSPKSEQKRRPWSICVSGQSHLVKMISPGILPSPVQGTPISTSPNSPNHAPGVRSTSELAIHCLAYSSSSCSTGLDDVGSTTGRGVGTGSDGVTPTRSSVDGEGVGSGAGSAGTSSSRRKKIRTRRRTLGQMSESGDSTLGEVIPSVRRGSRSSCKGLSSGSKGNCQSTSSEFSSSNMPADDTKEDEMDEDDATCQRKEKLARSIGLSLPLEDEEEEGEEKLGSMQTEETSSYSEQAWDNYQVCLSEGGEYTSDDDRTTKEQLLKHIMEFGDDYRQHFDSQSDGGSSLARLPPTPCSTLDSFLGDGQRSLPRTHSPTPPSPGSSRTGSGRRKRQAVTGLSVSSRLRPSYEETVPASMVPNHFPMNSLGPSSLSPVVNLIDKVCATSPMAVLDSDSDIEDVNHFLQETLSQVMYTESVMEETLGGGISPMTTPGKYPPPADYAEMAATCRENIKALRAFLNSVAAEDGGTQVHPRSFWAIQDLLQRWEMLESRAEECHQVRMVRQEIATLRDAMVSPPLGKVRNGRVEDLQSRKELDRRIQEVKAEIQALFELKSELLDVNVSVNRILTGASQPIQCPSVTTTNAPAGASSLGDSNSNGLEPSATEASGRPNDYAFLKNEVAEMYRDWDESLARLNAELAALQRASRTWAELDDGLASLGSALSSDRSTLAALSTAVAAARTNSADLPAKDTSSVKTNQTSAELTASVRELARVLSEEKGTVKLSGPRGDKEDPEEDQWESNNSMEATDLNGEAHINFIPADPLGSLSDSGISDSGSEGRGVCERGRRLAALRKLARALAASLGPNSPPLVALKQRIDDFQKELRSLQKTCRELVFYTAMLSTANGRQSVDLTCGVGCRNSSPMEANISVAANDGMNGTAQFEQNEEELKRVSMMLAEERITEEDLSSLRKMRDVARDDSVGRKKKGGGKGRRHWLWRVMCMAMPFHLAVLVLLYAAYFLEPHCCSAINNLSFSLTPQLHYVRGPPPI